MTATGVLLEVCLLVLFLSSEVQSTEAAEDKKNDSPTTVTLSVNRTRSTSIPNNGQNNDIDNNDDRSRNRRRTKTNTGNQRTHITQTSTTRKRHPRIAKAIKSYMRSKHISLSTLDQPTLLKLQNLRSSAAVKKKRKRGKRRRRKRRRRKRRRRKRRKKKKSPSKLGSLEEELSSGMVEGGRQSVPKSGKIPPQKMLRRQQAKTYPEMIDTNTQNHKEQSPQKASQIQTVDSAQDKVRTLQQKLDSSRQEIHGAHGKYSAQKEASGSREAFYVLKSLAKNHNRDDDEMLPRTNTLVENSGSEMTRNKLKTFPVPLAMTDEAARNDQQRKSKKPYDMIDSTVPAKHAQYSHQQSRTNVADQGTVKAHNQKTKKMPSEKQEDPSESTFKAQAKERKQMAVKTQPDEVETFAGRNPSMIADNFKSNQQPVIYRDIGDTISQVHKFPVQTDPKISKAEHFKKMNPKKLLHVDHNDDRLKAVISDADHYSNELSKAAAVLSQTIADTKQADEPLDDGGSMAHQGNSEANKTAGDKSHQPASLRENLSRAENTQPQSSVSMKSYADTKGSEQHLWIQGVRPGDDVLRMNKEHMLTTNRKTIKHLKGLPSAKDSFPSIIPYPHHNVLSSNDTNSPRYLQNPESFLQTSRSAGIHTDNHKLMTRIGQPLINKTTNVNVIAVSNTTHTRQSLLENDDRRNTHLKVPEIAVTTNLKQSVTASENHGGRLSLRNRPRLNQRLSMTHEEASATEPQHLFATINTKEDIKQYMTLRRTNSSDKARHVTVWNKDVNQPSVLNHQTTNPDQLLSLNASKASVVQKTLPGTGSSSTDKQSRPMTSSDIPGLKHNQQVAGGDVKHQDNDQNEGNSDLSELRPSLPMNSDVTELNPSQTVWKGGMITNERKNLPWVNNGLADQMQPLSVVNSDIIDDLNIQPMTYNDIAKQEQSQHMRNTDIINQLPSQLMANSDIRNQLQNQRMAKTDIRNQFQSQPFANTDVTNQLQSHPLTKKGMVNPIQTQSLENSELANQIYIQPQMKYKTTGVKQPAQTIENNIIMKQNQPHLLLIDDVTAMKQWLPRINAITEDSDLRTVSDNTENRQPRVPLADSSSTTVATNPKSSEQDSSGIEHILPTTASNDVNLSQMSGTTNDNKGDKAEIIPSAESVQPAVWPVHAGNAGNEDSLQVTQKTNVQVKTLAVTEDAYNEEFPQNDTFTISALTATKTHSATENQKLMTSSKNMGKLQNHKKAALNTNIKPKHKTQGHHIDGNIPLFQKLQLLKRPSFSEQTPRDRFEPRRKLQHEQEAVEGRREETVFAQRRNVTLNRVPTLPLPTQLGSSPFRKLLPMNSSGNSSALWIVHSGTKVRPKDDILTGNKDNSSYPRNLSFFGTHFVSYRTMVTSVGMGTTFVVFCCFLCVCGVTRWHRQRQYRKAFNKMEKSFSDLDTDKPFYIRLARLRRSPAGNQYVVTIVDDSKFSVVEHDLESEEEIFDVTDIVMADKKGPLTRLQWTNQNIPY